MEVLILVLVRYVLEEECKFFYSLYLFDLKFFWFCKVFILYFFVLMFFNLIGS